MIYFIFTLYSFYIDFLFTLQCMQTAEHYVTNSAEIDLSKCTLIPDAPRIDKKEKGTILNQNLNVEV